MKKTLSLILASLAVLFLVPADSAFSAEAGNYAEQLGAFVNQVSVWKPKAKASYAYTDLDQDGFLEVLTSFTSKKGAVTNTLFELRDSRLVEVTLSWEKGDDQPELKEKSVPAYYDSENDIYYYLFGTETEEAPVTALSLKDGVLTAEAVEDIASRFEGMAAKKASFGWISTAEHTLNDAPLEQLSELGGESIGGFKLSDN